LSLWIGHLSEQLGCLPSEAYAEWQRWPFGFLEEVIEARAYAQAHRAIDGVTEKKARQQIKATYPLAATVEQLELELRNDARKSGH
jgi:hypothetical protein